MSVQAATDSRHRLDVFSEHVATALRELRVTRHPGALSGALAECFIAHLGTNERALLAAAAVQAADAEFRADIHSAIEPVPRCTLTAKQIARSKSADRWGKALRRWGLGRGEWTAPPQREFFK